MPSILSLAFPEENPSLNRTAGAIIPVFLVVGLSFDSIMRYLGTLLDPRIGKVLIGLVAVMFIFFSARQNYDLVFEEYNRQFRLNAWNTSELGAVIRQFADSAGDSENAWVVPYPHWVDTRLVGIRAGYPERDFARWPADIEETLAIPQMKLFLYKPEDEDTAALLETLYPQGSNSLYESPVPGKNFIMFFVPPAKIEN
jgi:hypothetical protein